jgi:nitrate reductase NapAB chaperone NapD
LKEGELLVSSVLLARMNRRLQALEAALREVELTDLQSTDERIAKLCHAARRLRRMVVGPPTR